MKKGITVSGTGSATAPPDRAILTLGASIARQRALAAVEGRVEQLASLAGTTLGRPLSIVESAGSAAGGPFGARLAMAEAVPVEAGAAPVQVSRTVRYSLVG